MAKSKAQKRLEANLRSLPNHFFTIDRLLTILPGGKNFNLSDYKSNTSFVYNHLYRGVLAIQSSAQRLDCSMVGHIDAYAPNRITVAHDPAYIGMVIWDPKKVILWLLSDDNLPNFVSAVNIESSNYPAVCCDLAFDRVTYDVLIKQVRYYIESHIN